MLTLSVVGYENISDTDIMIKNFGIEEGAVVRCCKTTQM